jgi:S1-C subfamily serine protease
MAAAGAAAALGGAALALALASASGNLGSTTVEQVTVAAPGALPAPVALRLPASRTSGGLDAAALYAARAPSVVTLETWFGPHPTATGSGFVVDAARGLILTNSHVITNSAEVSDPRDVQRPDHVYVELLDGERAEGHVLGYDLFDDVGVVRVDPRDLHLEAAPLGSSQAVRVGDPVAAIGSPFGEAGSLSVGVVSQLGRQIPTPSQA